MNLFSLAGSRSCASHTAQPENGSEKKMNATSGRKCLDQFERLNRDGSWAKTFSALLIGMEGWYSTRCRLTWKLKGTKYNRLYFQLQPSTLPTEGTGFGLLLTPTAVMTDETPEAMRERAERNGYQNGTKYGSLLSQVKYSGLIGTPTVSASIRSEEFRKGRQPTPAEFAMGFLPTPTACDIEGGVSNPEQISMKNNRWIATRKGTGTEFGAKLRDVAGLLPTPRASEHKGVGPIGSKSHNHMLEKDYLCAVIQEQTGQTSQLNHQFVLEMMGFPPDWLELPFQSTETNPSKPPETP